MCGLWAAKGRGYRSALRGRWRQPERTASVSSATRCRVMASSVNIDAQIVEFADAHRRTLRTGDDLLGNDLVGTVEKAILLAVVARSASDTLSWIKTRQEDGDRLAALLAGLSDELQAHDVLGRSLHQTQQSLLAKARQLVMAAAGVATTPVWLTSAIALLLGLFGFAANFGSAIGGFLALALFAFLALAAIAPPVRAWTLGLLFRTPQALMAAGGTVIDTARSLSAMLVYSTSLGNRAYSVFVDTASKEVAALRGPSFMSGEAKLVVEPLRVLAGAIVVASIVTLAVCLVILAIGINHGFFQQVVTCEQQYAPQSNCGFSK
jgi:hypothetical protein